MLDPSAAASKTKGPRLDLHQHLAELEAAGLLVRIDRPINKDTELNPLVRWQFIGGVPEDDRRAFIARNIPIGLCNSQPPSHPRHIHRRER